MRGNLKILPVYGEGDRSRRVWGRGLSTMSIARGDPPSTKPLRALVPLPVNGEDLG
jgi:hypothetical protein